LVFADPPSLDNPELTFNLPLREPSDEGSYRVEQVVWRWPGGETQYRNASVIGRSEEQRITEVKIEGDNTPVFDRADRYRFRICRPTKTLCRYRSHLVPCLT
jgi:hypothetical protein